MQASRWQAHFQPFREKIIGQAQSFEGPFGRKNILYADWIASGRLYAPIEEKLARDLGPYVANTHTETSYTGALMTQAYARARRLIKQHLNASAEDVLIMTGTGMTGAVVKLQRILGLKVPEQFNDRLQLDPALRPVVFVSHMEHHSNHTSWLETICEVVQIQAQEDGLPDLAHLRRLLKEYEHRPLKIASITSCSNVTGIFTPYREVAALMHAAEGLCFVDFACSGPYVDIDMHPPKEDERLDAIFFSPHKFLGGPGTPGVLVFHRSLYKLKVPDQPGGGTVTWTNPWGGHHYFDDIEVREDGGTPGFLQTIKAALAIQLKEEMGTEAIAAREKELLSYTFKRLEPLENLHVLAGQHRDRLGVLSFYIEDCHYNLVVSLLNDLYGIQTRGGCSCAGTYGHYLLHVDPRRSAEITNRIDAGDLSQKPGWVRLSIHPVFSNAEMKYICDALEHIARHWRDYRDQYFQPTGSIEFKHREALNLEKQVEAWFEKP